MTLNLTCNGVAEATNHATTGISTTTITASGFMLANVTTSNLALFSMDLKKDTNIVASLGPGQHDISIYDYNIIYISMKTNSAEGASPLGSANIILL